MRYFVTGCAGFVGSTLVDRLLDAGASVVGFDNFSTGRDAFIAAALAHPNFALRRADLLDAAAVRSAAAGCDAIVHLAANADVRFGADHPLRDFEQNVGATMNVLEAARVNGIKDIAFASTGSIYGEAALIPTPEDAPIPIQTSLYGASKIAAEGFIEAYAQAFDLRAYIFRFVSLLGERYTHGHVLDFCRQLRAHPAELHVLGDGEQRKSYLYVGDCIDAMLLVLGRPAARVNIYNLGSDSYCQVKDSVGWICERLGVRPRVTLGGGDRGWIGDNPFIFLDCARIRRLGWKPTLDIRAAVERTVDFIVRENL